MSINQVKSVMTQIAAMDNDKTKIDSAAEKRIAKRILDGRMFDNLSHKEWDFVSSWLDGSPVAQCVKTNAERRVIFPKKQIRSQNALFRKLGIENSDGSINAEYYVVKYDEKGLPLVATYYDKAGQKIVTEVHEFYEEEEGCETLNGDIKTYKAKSNAKDYSIELNCKKEGGFSDFKSFCQNIPVAVKQLWIDLFE